MKNIYYYLLLLCQCFVIACSSSSTEEPIFPREEVILQELLPLTGVTNPVRLELDSAFLILQNWGREDSLFHIYDLHSFELKHAFGATGQGPDEYIAPDLHNTNFPGFLISDNGNVVYHIRINENGMPIDKTKKQIYFIDSALNAAFLNDSLFVIDAYQYAPELFLLSLQDELPRKTKQIRSPRIQDPVLDPDLASAAANDTRVILYYWWKKQIDFLDTDLNLINRVKFEYPNPRSISRDLGSVITSYSHAFCGENYFYALYKGASVDDYFANPSAYNDFLEVFDLDGNPVTRYKLDGKGMSRFVVDENTFTLYGIINDGVTEDYLGMYRLAGLE